MGPQLRLAFVVPALDGPQTGGTIYNRLLIGALRELGVRCTVVSREQALATSWRSDTIDVIWVDSLYLRDELVHRLRCIGETKRGLLLHALPSVIEDPDAPLRTEPFEARALAAADLTLVPSATFAAQVRARAPHASLIVLEPGVETRASWPAPPRARRALIAQHVVANKHLLEWLCAMAPRLRADDAFHIEVVGRLDLDAEYAERCTRRVHAHPQLARVVRLVGERPQATLHRLMQGSELVVSTSPFETFNMALAEARSLGVPILARAGGHSAAHVDTRAGGALATNHEELARLVLECIRDPLGLEERRRLAAMHKPAPRAWIDAAHELLAALSRATPA